MRRVGALLIAIVFLSGTSCLGDQSHNVTLINETFVNLTVYPYGRQQSQFNHVLSPGSRATENVTTDSADSTYVARVEAVDDSGALLLPAVHRRSPSTARLANTRVSRAAQLLGGRHRDDS